MFSSSISCDIDTNKLRETLNCDLEIIPTHHIHHHPGSTDPDTHPQSMVNQHLSAKGCYDFAILATGSSDISELDVKNTPPTTLTSAVADQTKTMVEIAESLSTNNNINMFIVEHSPRYDPPTQDPTGMYSKLAKYSNGVLASSVGVTPRLFIVEQSSLARFGAKPRSDVFKPDGVHLTSKGLSYYTSNITRSLMECYPDMAMTTTRQQPHAVPQS